MDNFPKTRRRDLLGLAAAVLTARVRQRDVGVAFAEWLRGLTRRHQSPNIDVDLVACRVLFVSGSHLARHILHSSPAEQIFVAGTMKRKAMSFLAPNALTVLDGEKWRALRAFNEEVLRPGTPHALLPLQLAKVEEEFERPLEGIEDIRRRMGQVMLHTVFGENRAPHHLVADIQELFAEVNLRTALVGSRKTAKRDQFREQLRRLWNESAGNGGPSFLAFAHRASAGLAVDCRREEFLLDQIPHWMFTFTSSGSDLLGRTLSLILARPAVLARVRREVDAARPLSTPGEFANLPYLEACVWETARLYPPVVQAAHKASRDQTFERMDIAAGTEIFQYFPLVNRDVSIDPLANYFWPERWLDPGDAIHSRELNIFLSGPRTCPGKDIILFVVKSAIARLLRDEQTRPQHSLLSDDPLPFSFAGACYSL